MSVDDDESLSAKILLMQASNRSRIKSWMKTTQEINDNEIDEQAEQAFKDIKASNENVGIGFDLSNDLNDEVDDLTRANEALRRKFLSKDALKRHQQSQSSAQLASKPMPKQQKIELSDDSEPETKGTSRKKKPTMKPDNKAERSPEVNDIPVISKSKKRPGSYMDQLLADRRKKSRSATKSKWLIWNWKILSTEMSFSESKMTIISLSCKITEMSNF